MSKDTIKISDDAKEKLDGVKDDYYEYTTLTYSEAVEVLVAEYEGSGDSTSTSNAGSAGSQSASETGTSDDGVSESVEQKINKAKLDSSPEVDEGNSNEDETASLSPEELKSRTET